ncbi:unnamed protein product, partial [Rotaria sp. Silwood2]
MSPFFTIYGGILLILQYISSFKISFDQFKFAYDRRTMEQIGIKINDYSPAFISLFVKISFEFWRRTAYTFHLIIVIYSMIILIGLYIYQFQRVNIFLSSKISKELLAFIGLEIVASEVLAIKLLTPSIFLFVNIMQLYYFHSDWMKLITMP